MRRFGWVLVSMVSLFLVVALVLPQEAPKREASPNAPVMQQTGELRGGVLICKYASHWSQITGLAENSKDRADLTRQVIEAGFCIEATPGAVVEVYENAGEVWSDGIISPADSAYMIVFPDDRMTKQVAGRTPGWWVAQAAVEVRS